VFDNGRRAGDLRALFNRESENLARGVLRHFRKILWCSCVGAPRRRAEMVMLNRGRQGRRLWETKSVARSAGC
jgi:hypothetical protein